MITGTNMNEEIDESEFFHQDFTTASEWEIFIARIEEIIHSWRVDTIKEEEENSKTKPADWVIKSENVPFGDVDFTLFFYKRFVENSCSTDNGDDGVKNPMDSTYDFVLSDNTYTNPEHYISLWYGLDQYYVLVPSNNAAVITESRIKVLLSSIYIVTGNLNTNIPFFVRIREKWQKCFLGVYEGEGVRTNFEMVHLKRGPQHCQYLTGLLELFKTKIMSPAPLAPISISLQLIYHLTDFGAYTWKQEIPDYEAEHFDSGTLCILPFGVSFDPVHLLVLRAKWSNLVDHMVVDSENYSDFDPMQAPLWSLALSFTDEPICLLSECITEFLHLLDNNSTVYDMLGDYAKPPAESNNPLDLLTESKVPTISSVLKRAARNSFTKNRKGIAPLSEDLMVPILYFLFPDADDEPAYPYKDKKKRKDSSTDSGKNNEEQFRGFKTCGVDSLVWRFGIVLAQALHSLGGVRALSHLWFEFSQEMRYRWEKCILLPGFTAVIYWILISCRTYLNDDSPIKDAKISHLLTLMPKERIDIFQYIQKMT